MLSTEDRRVRRGRWTWRALPWLSALAVLAGATAAAPAAAQAARVIVAFQSDAPALRERARPLAAERRAFEDALQRRADGLAGRAGRALRSGRSLGDRIQVVHADGIDSDALAARLAGDPSVAWAVPDRRRRALAVPNDPLYPQVPTGTRPRGPDAGQWYLRPPDALFRSAADFQSAWDRRSGSAGMVVAVLDTGVRPDHPDLAGVLVPNGRLSPTGAVLYGIDTISDAATANDGDGADADASDPGDWITTAENASGAFKDCGAGPSSWHGTHVSTIVAAVANDGIGMAGAAHGVRILPVRVLGKCGGFDSDIIAGMLWAAGLQTVAGVANANPAKVLNLSLGGSGSCSAAYSDAISRINATGAIVVAAAGNGAGRAVGAPANCPGAIGVGGLRHAGSKVGFSDLGPEIALSAPGGNCVNINGIDPCLYPILAGTNSGTQQPNAGGSTWTDSFDISVGTSFAAPLVAAAGALMMIHRPELRPGEIRDVLRSTTRPFPQSGADNGPSDPTPVVACRAPNGTDQLQCYCPTDGSLCGSGMLDAAAAVRGVEAGFARPTLLTASPQAGTALSVGGGTSLAPLGRAVAGYEWALVDGGGIVTGFDSATNAASASLTPSAAGALRVRLTVVDDIGGRTSSELSIAVAAAPPPPTTPPPASGGGGGAWSLADLAGLLIGFGAWRAWASRRRRTHD